MAYQSLHDRLKGPMRKALQDELSIKNVHAVPRIEKVVVNVGINKSKHDSKEMRAYIEESLSLITGQKPVFTKSRKAISNFKIRENMVIGAMVTLRGKQAEEFLDRLLSYALPRVRDFRGLSLKLDGNGNYSIGIRDHSIFPELPPVDASKIFGLQIQITTTAKNDEEGFALLKQIGMPFRPAKSESAKKEEEQKEEAAKAKAEAEEAAAPEEKAEDSKESEESSSDEAPEEKSEKKEDDSVDSPEENSDNADSNSSPTS